MIIKNVWTIYNISQRENNGYNFILKPMFIYEISWRWWISLTQSWLSVYLFQCDSVLLPWIPFKSEGVFPLNNKNPGIFEGLIYWASSNDYWAEYLSLSEGSVSYIHDIADAAQDHIHSLIDTLFVQ